MKSKIWIILYSLILTGVFVCFLYLFEYPPFIIHIVKLKPVSLIFIEYFKIICTWPVAIFASVVFLSFNFKEPLSSWISHLKISYGGAIVSSDLQNLKNKSEVKSEKIPETTNSNEPSTKDPQLPTEIQKLETFAQQWRLAAYLWEYKYLNFFLAGNTKQILQWIDSINKINLEAANAVWSPLIPSLQERSAILEVLIQHHLVLIINNQEIEITPKGKEYVAMMLKQPSNG